MKKKTHTLDGLSSMVSSNVTDSGMSESSEPLNALLSDSITSANNHISQQQLTGTQAQQSSLSTGNAANNGMEQGHSRNSSNTSQVSMTTCAQKRLFIEITHFVEYTNPK